MHDLMREVIAEKGWTLSEGIRQISLYSGAGERTVERWIAGRAHPRVDYLPGICVALGLSPDELLRWPESRDASIRQAMDRSREAEERQAAVTALVKRLATDDSTGRKRRNGG